MLHCCRLCQVWIRAANPAMENFECGGKAFTSAWPSLLSLPLFEPPSPPGPASAVLRAPPLRQLQWSETSARCPAPDPPATLRRATLRRWPLGAALGRPCRPAATCAHAHEVGAGRRSGYQHRLALCQPHTSMRHMPYSASRCQRVELEFIGMVPLECMALLGP